MEALPSLLVVLDDVRLTDMCFFRISPNIAQRATLAQEIPALIEFGLNFL